MRQISVFRHLIFTTWRTSICLHYWKHVTLFVSGILYFMSCHINHVTYHYTELSWTYHFNNYYYFTDVIFYCISESNKFYACKFVSKSSLIHVGHYFIKSQRVKYLSCFMEWLRSWNCQSYHFLLLRKLERDGYKSTKD